MDSSFSLGSDIVVRYFCNTLDEAQISSQAKPFDVVVIGSGMYGSYIASRLYYQSRKMAELGFRKRLKVLVLEAGPYLLYEHIENVPQGMGGIFSSVNKAPYLCDVQRAKGQSAFFSTDQVLKHSYCVGGKSLTWGKWAPRLTEKALESWPKEVADFLRSDKGYTKLEKETGVDDKDDLTKGILFKHLKPILDEKLKSDNNKFNMLELKDPPIAVSANSAIPGVYSPDAFSSLGRLLQNIRTESSFPDVGVPPYIKSLFLVPNTLAYQLETDQGRVSKIKVVHRYPVYNPEQKKIEEKFEEKSFELSKQCDVILAGTGIESTRLALNSFPRSRTLKQPQELIGRNLMGHLFCVVTVRIKRKALKGLGENVLESALFHLQGHSEHFKKSYHFQMFCNSDQNFNAFTTLYKMFYDLEEASDILKQSQNKDWVNLWILPCSELAGKPNAPLYSPGSSWMDLSKNEIEKFGNVEYAKPYLKWESSQEDEEFWDEVLATLFDFLAALVPFGDIEYQEPNSQEWTTARPTQYEFYQTTEAFWNSRHESGTLWMGENAYESVTDLDGKLHHIQNVYCADQAIFPTVGSANPVLTGLCLNRRISQAIIDRYKDFPDDFNPKDFPEIPELSAEFDLKSQGFEALFDGTSESWDEHWSIQSKGEYSICPGRLLLKPKTNIGLAWYKTKAFSNFELVVDWKIFDYFTNSGIVIHAPNPAEYAEYDDAEIYKKGYEIQIDETGYDYINTIYGSPSHKTGAIYDLSPANRGNAKKPGFWNRFRITSKNNEIKVCLNGRLVSHLPSLLPDRKKEGYICLQFHTNEIQFRNIMIRKL